MSFRSCSQDPNKPCNARFFQQLRNLSDAVHKVPFIQQHLYQGLPPELYQDPRWEKHVQDDVRGRGYWFWKPALVNLLLRKGTLQMDDIVVWCDADAYNLDDMWAPELWSAFAHNYDQDILVQSQPHCEATWTKGDIFNHFGVKWDDPHYGLTVQPKAQFWVVRLNERTVKFMRHWEDLVSNFSLVSDLRSGTPNSPLFRENRHDQSLYSMLLKANRLKTGTTGECQMYERGRHQSAVLPEDPEHASAVELASANAPELHPRYGIKGLKLLMDSFRQEAKRLLELGGPTKAIVAAKASAPFREICVRGRCYDLEALPPDALPSGVE